MENGQSDDTAPEPRLDRAFWESHWQSRNTGWDIGYASPAIVQYMLQYSHKDAAILIAGCGNAYEAEWLSDHGFGNVTLLDIAPKAVATLEEKFASAKAIRVLCGDFFEHRGRYDLMIEQTFFCAIAPARRPEYVTQASALLRPGGRIVGLLFDKTFEKPGPPFGGSSEEYKALFEPLFHVHKLEACYNSIGPRAGAEVFINFQSRSDP